MLAICRRVEVSGTGAYCDALRNFRQRYLAPFVVLFMCHWLDCACNSSTSLVNYAALENYLKYKESVQPLALSERRQNFLVEQTGKLQISMQFLVIILVQRFISKQVCLSTVVGF